MLPYQSIGDEEGQSPRSPSTPSQWKVALVLVTIPLLYLFLFGVRDRQHTQNQPTQATLKVVAPPLPHQQPQKMINEPLLVHMRDAAEATATAVESQAVVRTTVEEKEDLKEGFPPPSEKPPGNLFFFHFADTHVDPFFEPTQTMGPCICHSCRFSQKVFGKDTFCPTTLPNTEDQGINQGYAFGRYRCNPPVRLQTSLFEHLKKLDPSPHFIAHSGDIAPHGYPDDMSRPSANTKLSDFCMSKPIVFRHHIRQLRKAFPNTTFALAMGNNDHFPKNTYWQPYITWVANMLFEEGILTKAQRDMFELYGGYYADVGSLRLVAMDLTLFLPGGETTFVTEKDLADLKGEERQHKLYPVRHRTVEWFRDIMADAKKKNMAVYLVGHQPLATKKGKDEMDIRDPHYMQFQGVLGEHQDIIRVAMFGHRNYAGLQPILDTVERPIIPSLTIPGVSPRGLNNPSFSVMFYDPKTFVIEDFEQWIFILGDENAKARFKGPSYLGTWRQHRRDLFSWRAVSGGMPFTVGSLVRHLSNTSYDMATFFRYETWKRGGYVGDETPENYHCKAMYDESDSMMRCLFKDQDPKCWNEKWLA